MSKITGVRQQRVQFFYDTDFMTSGIQTAATATADIATSQKTLFANAQPGNFARTNMPSPGFLAGDQTFLAYALRHEVGFYSGASPTAPVSAGGGANPVGFTGTAAVAFWTINLSTFRFQVGEKVEFEGPIVMTPAGGGPWGFVSDSAQPIVLNGEPQQRAIYVLPLPVAITKRQAIKMEENKHSLTGSTAVDILNVINGYTGGRLFRAYIDGFNTRDVQ